MYIEHYYDNILKAEIVIFHLKYKDLFQSYKYFKEHILKVSKVDM